MPRIRCNYEGCVHLEGNFCGTDEIRLDPEEGCLTFTSIEDLALNDEDWEEELFGSEDEDKDIFDTDDDDDGYDPSEWN